MGNRSDKLPEGLHDVPEGDHDAVENPINRNDIEPIDDEYLKELKTKISEKSCGCDRSVYKPVCATDGIAYANRCFLGCQILRMKDDTLKIDYNGLCDYHDYIETDTDDEEFEEELRKKNYIP